MPNIKLKDGSGVEQTYSNINTITVPLADGTGTHTFGVSNSDLAFSGDCNYLLYNSKIASFYQQFKDRITTSNISSWSTMFNGWTGDVPFSINYNNTSSSSIQLSNFPTNSNSQITNFSGGINISAPSAPYINDIQNWFGHQEYLRNFPTITGLKELLQAQPSNQNCQFASSLGYCYSLRSIPSDLLKEFYNRGSSNGWSYHIYYNFTSNYAMDKVEGMPVYRNTLTSDVFNYCGKSCCRLSEFKFDTNDGTPYSVNWKNQTLNLSSYTGYAQYASNIIGYNSGITTAKQVTDATSYAALKNDEDWWTLDSAYSRYNHDSAVNTINSLPDCSSSGGTNTIKFLGVSGASTDGGAINTLTSAEIAVATNKGWTVTIV